MPITMDVFKSDAFSAISLSAAVEKMEYVPGFLGSLGLFEPMAVRTEDVWIEERSYGASVLQTTPRGAPTHNVGGDIRKARGFKTVRVADASRVNAAELQGIRAFGSETELKQLADEVARRQMKMMQNVALTHENMRLGCVQGLVTDADGSTIYAWDTEFSQTIPAEVDFDLDNASPASGVLRQRVTAAKRSIIRGLKGKMPSQIVALCGDTFWDQLIAHPEVRDIYLGTPFSQALADDVTWKYGAVDWFDFAGVRFANYRGTDDNSTVAIGTLKAKFFPVGSGIFQWVMAPGESFDQVNTLGQNFYSMVVPDDDRNRYVDVELYSYPLPVCTMPQALYRARNT